MQMDSDSSYKPNGDYLMSPYSWHTTQDLQFAAANAPVAVYPYGDYGPVVVKSEYDDCDGGNGDIIGGVGAGRDCSAAGSGGSPGLELDSVEPKKGMYNT